MTDEISGNADSKDGGEPSSVPPWLRVTSADLTALDFELPIASSTTADCGELSELFQTAAQVVGAAGEPQETSIARVFAMLSAVTGMYFKSEERNEPFGPMVVFADGRRSAIPSDFRGAPVDVLAEMAEQTKNPTLRARIADVCWLLQPKRSKLGNLAVATYVEIVQQVENGGLRYRFQENDEVFHFETRDHLRRALQIGRAIGWDKTESIAARDVVVKLRKRAAESLAPVPIHWFSKLDLDFLVSDPAEVGADLDTVLAALPPDVDSHVVVDFWRLAARAYHLAKRNDDKYRCQSEAAERLVSEAEHVLARQNSAMLAAHTLSSALGALHGVPGKRDRRTALRHRLVDVQARIPEEMSVFTQDFDLQEIGQKVEEIVERENLLGKLFVMAQLARSPDPAELIKNAMDVIQKHPLSSIFGASHLDSEGKVIHRTEGASFGDNMNDSAIQGQIAQSEAIRRKFVAFGQIETARRTIVKHHFLSEDIFTSLLRFSPFVPPDLMETIGRGFMRFFQGDLVSATYILTPLLENLLRYILKAYGHDVSIFDDATQTQEDRTISSLFEQMRSELDAVFTKAITTDIENVFLTKAGPHLRHSVAHGLLNDGDPYGADAIYGCALIFRLCVLPLYPYREQLHFQFDQ